MAIEIGKFEGEWAELLELLDMAFSAPWTDEQKQDLAKVVVDKIAVHFNIGHLVIGGSDTKEPYGRYLVAGNKLSKGRHLSVGPSQPSRTTSSPCAERAGWKVRFGSSWASWK